MLVLGDLAEPDHADAVWLHDGGCSDRRCTRPRRRVGCSSCPWQSGWMKGSLCFMGYEPTTAARLTQELGRRGNRLVRVRGNHDPIDPASVHVDDLEAQAVPDE